MGCDLHPLILRALRALGDHSNLAMQILFEAISQCFEYVLIITAAVTYQLCHVLFMSYLYLYFIQLF